MNKTPHSLLFLWRRPLLLLLLLFLCCASVCVAQKDGGDAPSTGVVRELPRKGQSGMQAYTVATQENEKWEPIRIKAFTRDLEDKSKYCTEVNQKIVSFFGNVVKCFEADDLNDERHREYINEIIPAAIKLHEERLRVQPHKGKIIVPELEGDYCENFTVPEEHRTEGVDADFVLYVAAIPWHYEVGLACARENSSGRPIVGVMSFIPSLYGGLRLNVRRAAHEMAHALGFNIFEMDEKNMLSHVIIRGNNRTVVSSELTKKKAQEHYGCSDLEGVELTLRDEAHWLQRVAKDELMAAPRESGAGYYTALTMSTFEGLGYYRANWGMEEPMSWGHKGGCNFLKETCTENEKHYSEQFCNDTTALRCTSDRTAYGMWYRGQQREYQGPNDVCHVIGSFVKGNDNVKTYTYCTGAETNALPGSLMGPDSWCLDGEGLQVQNAGESVESLSGVCARVSCDERRRTVSVQYKGSDTFKECPEGTSIDVESSAFQSGGKIKCPKYDEVCTIALNGSSLVPFVNPHQPSAVGATLINGKDNANTNDPSKYPGVVNQAQINNMQNSTGILTELAKDNAFSAVYSFPIMIVTMVLAVVLSC